jgi:hypothetical protein
VAAAWAGSPVWAVTWRTAPSTSVINVEGLIVIYASAVVKAGVVEGGVGGSEERGGRQEG